MASTNSHQCSRYVDMWALPGFHPTNIELLQKLKTADSRHFTHNMDAVGTVSEKGKTGGWEETHLIGVRTDVWQPDKETLNKTLRKIQKQRKRELRQEIKRSGRLNASQSKKLDEKLAGEAMMSKEPTDIVNQRLVLKLFKTTSERMQWCGTIEEVTTTEMHSSIATKKPMLSMAVMLPRIKIVTHIQQSHRTFRFPSLFSFCYFHNNRAFPITLKRRWFSLGADYDLVCHDKPLGEIDSQLLCLGSDSYVNLGGHELAECRPFQDLMTLFAASIGYHRQMRKKVKQRIRASLAGEAFLNVVEDEELRLHYNGRNAA